MSRGDVARKGLLWEIRIACETLLHCGVTRTKWDLKNVAVFFKKPLDKPHSVWYNKHVIKGSDQTARKEVKTMTNTKTTIRSQFEAVRAELVKAGREDLVEFIDGRIAQTVKKNSTERKPTAKQIENEGFKSDILAFMEPNVLYAAGDILKGVPSIVAAGMSINRVSALMTQLKDAGAVTVTVDKRKNFYTLAE